MRPAHRNFHLLPALLLCCLVALVGSAVAAESAEPILEEQDPALTRELAEQYRLAPGDRLKISVLGQPDLSVEVEVSDNDSIIYPLLGEVMVAGLSRKETEELIHRELKGPYLVEPVVSVTITAYRPVFLQGEVERPGPYPYAPGMSLRRAILNAGGFTDIAATGRIYVINEADPGKTERRIDMDYQLKPGDVVTVKASFF